MKHRLFRSLSVAFLSTIFLLGGNGPQAEAAPQPCRVIHVDQNHPASADDSTRDGTDRNIPYQTIDYAIDHADSCDEIWVYPGVYVENIESEDHNTKLIAKRSVGYDVILQAAHSGVAVHIDRDAFTIEGFVVESALGTGIRFHEVSGGVARDNIVRNATGSGIYVKSSAAVSVENNVVHHNNRTGIKLDRNQSDITILNNRVYSNGEWGIYIDAASSGSGGYTVEFNTVDDNGIGGINVVRKKTTTALGTVVHNIVTNNGLFGAKVLEDGFQVGFNCFHQNGRDFATKPEVQRLGGDVYGDPLYVNPGLETGYQLSHLYIQGSDSPCLNAGNIFADTAQIRGSTATDQGIDEGLVDLGYHTPGQTYPMQVQIEEADFDFNQGGIEESDTLTFRGILNFDVLSDGVNPANERVKVTSGPFSAVLPVGSFLSQGGQWEYLGSAPGVTELTVGPDGTFSVTIDGIALPETDSAGLDFVIGADAGSDQVQYNRGTLLFR